MAGTVRAPPKMGLIQHPHPPGKHWVGARESCTLSEGIKIAQGAPRRVGRGPLAGYAPISNKRVSPRNRLNQRKIIWGEYASLERKHWLITTYKTILFYYTTYGIKHRKDLIKKIIRFNFSRNHYLKLNNFMQIFFHKKTNCYFEIFKTLCTHYKCLPCLPLKLHVMAEEVTQVGVESIIQATKAWKAFLPFNKPIEETPRET